MAYFYFYLFIYFFVTLVFKQFRHAAYGIYFLFAKQGTIYSDDQSMGRVLHRPPLRTPLSLVLFCDHLHDKSKISTCSQFFIFNRVFNQFANILPQNKVILIQKVFLIWCVLKKTVNIEFCIWCLAGNTNGRNIIFSQCAKEFHRKFLQ